MDGAQARLRGGDHARDGVRLDEAKVLLQELESQSPIEDVSPAGVEDTDEITVLLESDGEDTPVPEPEPEPEPDKIVGYYTMERKKNEDGTPKKVPLYKGPKDGLYYVNEAGNKVYGTPSSRHVEMIEAAADVE